MNQRVHIHYARQVKDLPIAQLTSCFRQTIRLSRAARAFPVVLLYLEIASLEPELQERTLHFSYFQKIHFSLLSCKNNFTASLLKCPLSTSFAYPNGSTASRRTNGNVQESIPNLGLQLAVPVGEAQRPMPHPPKVRRGLPLFEHGKITKRRDLKASQNWAKASPLEGPRQSFAYGPNTSENTESTQRLNSSFF